MTGLSSLLIGRWWADDEDPDAPYGPAWLAEKTGGREIPHQWDSLGVTDVDVTRVKEFAQVGFDAGMTVYRLQHPTTPQGLTIGRCDLADQTTDVEKRVLVSLLWDLAYEEQVDVLVLQGSAGYRPHLQNIPGWRTPDGLDDPDTTVLVADGIHAAQPAVERLTAPLELSKAARSAPAASCVVFERWLAVTIVGDRSSLRLRGRARRLVRLLKSRGA